MKPGDEGFPQREYLPDLTQGQLLAVVQRNHQPLFRRKRVDRGAQRASQAAAGRAMRRGLFGSR